MSLKLYSISTMLNHPDNLAKFRQTNSAKDIFAFFHLNRGAEREIMKRRLEFIAASGYTLENIDITDYIYSPSALLFSARIVDKIGDTMKNDIKVFPCTVICQGEKLSWNAVQITRQLSIVDMEKSTYRTLADGEKVIKFARYKEDINEVFYITRDSKNITHFVVSELFRKLCEENELKISFQEANNNLSYCHNFL